MHAQPAVLLDQNVETGRRDKRADMGVWLEIV